MTPGAQTRHRARLDAFALFNTVPYGSRINVSTIARTLSGHRRGEIMPKSVANFLKERTDFRHCGNGIWERVTVPERGGVRP